MVTKSKHLGNGTGTSAKDVRDTLKRRKFPYVITKVKLKKKNIGGNRGVNWYAIYGHRKK